MKSLHVVAGIVSNARGEVLIQQRSDGPFAGCWEFPGGKVESGEARADGLRRELAEELGVDVVASEPLLRLTHRYPARTVDLDVWRVLRADGEPRGLEGQPLRWVHPLDLGDADLLPADGPVVTALLLPRVFHITPAPSNAEQRLQFEPNNTRGRSLTGFVTSDVQSLSVAANAAPDFAVWRNAPPDDFQVSQIIAGINVPVYLGTPVAAKEEGAQVARAIRLGAQGVALENRGQ